ncbi:MAG: hypothetical protein WCH11_06145, partial [Bdellovibrio sp.]
NHRYLLNEKSYGDLDASVLDDRLFASSDRVRVFRSALDRSNPINRWFLKYRHFYELPNGFVNRVQLKNASDLQYPLDFPRETGTASEGWLENRISVARSQSDQFWSVDASYYTNLLQSDPLSTNNDSVHQLPEFRWSLVEKRLGSSHFFLASDFRFNNFARSSFSYDEMNSNVPKPGSSSSSTNQRRLRTLGSRAICQTDSWETDPTCFAFRTGVYDPLKDQLRTGQRADLGLSLSHPWRFSRLDLLPRLTYKETHYLFGSGTELFNARRFARAEISTRTSFSALYEGSPKQDDVSRFKHEIQPEITYSTIPWIDHPAHAFWGNNSSATIPPSLQENISDADLNSPYALQFDYYDRIQDRKLLTYGITNKIVRKKIRPSGESTYSQLLSWKIAQAYDLFQVESSDPLAQAYSDVSSELVLSFDWFEVYQKANYYPAQKVTNTSTRFRFFNEQGESISLSYNSTFDTARGQPASQLQQEILFSGKKIFSQFDLILAGSYDQTPGAANPWKSYAYAVQYRLPGNCWYVIWSQFLETTGNFGWNVKFDFSWDGKPNPRLSEEALQARSTSWYTPSAF